MTPKPPTSSEGSPLPPRSRPNLGDFVKDSNELDLWAFDEGEKSESQPVKIPSRGSSSEIPAPREPRKKKQPEPEAPFPEKSLGNQNSIQVNVGSKDIRPMSQSAAAPKKGRPGDDFDDLDHWDEPEAVAPMPEAPPAVPSEPLVAEVPAEEEVRPESDQPTAAGVPTRADDLDEFSPVVPENAVPVSLVPHLGLSKLERIGLGTLLGVLLIGGAILYFSTIHRLPTESSLVSEGDFPVNGRHISILSADTFWRAPIMEGKNVETFRRGTQLLPVVSLTASGGPAALRLLFRNDDGLVMGDAVTRTVRPGEPLEIAATAGFEDVGMHAAYRTGQSKPWTIEVFEAPAATSPNPDFKKLFEINISTDRR